MVMNHKNFHFTQIPDKTNKVVFLNIFGHFCPMEIFLKKSGCHTLLDMGPEHHANKKKQPEKEKVDLNSPSKNHKECIRAINE